LRLAAFRPLDSRSADLLVNLALLPNQGVVCMRENNWEYALDCSAGMGQFYAAERGESYLSYWSSGLGQRDDGSVDSRWSSQQTLCARRPAEVAMELGVRYALNSDSSFT
jgi:hypothetical protein